jgi:cold shock protein
VSAREALEIARREDTLRRYREAVEKAWADKRVSYAEAERLSALANELGLSADTVADIEHRAIGAPKEELLGRQKGTVKWFSDEKGYGFISPDDESEDVFVYLSGTVGKGLKSLEEGVKVTYEVHQGRTGSRATNVRRVDPLN